ncbi:MAG: ATP-dependent DNA helicase RecG [Deltaproteobacteria bacterium]|nr:ATP-dependent DNA helicase RecG [Deltaproteobacteria bacterium]
MARPLEILSKMLKLEELNYDYQDRAVSGGLARYKETWRRQALEVFGETELLWIDDVANRLTAYSSLEPVARKSALQALRILLSDGPGVDKANASQEPEQKISPQYKPEKSVPGKGLEASIEYMSGVGSKNVELLAKLNVKTIRDFLRFYPRRYEDYSQLKTINHLQYGEYVSVLGTVWEAGGRSTHRGRHIFRVILSDATGTLEVTWFNREWLAKRIKSEMQILVSGKVDEYLGRLTMNAPAWEIVGRKDLTNVRIQPIYSLTEGLTQPKIRTIMNRTLSAWASRIPDPLPESMRNAHDLLSLSKALSGIHFPDSQEHLEKARRRLAFEEVLYLQLGLLRQKSAWKSQPGRALAFSKELILSYISALPYQLTGAQKRSLDEMLKDIASGQPMNRLLQGDVGSGKTVVAALLMTLVSTQGYQAAMMAPTEILAEQHYKSLSQLFSLFPEPKPTLHLLTGSTSKVERDKIYSGLADGSIHMVVGTHALIQQSVTFDDLAFVIIDEQHRSGVEQRGELRKKGYNPHLMVMTATPIPRSLELTVWGHLDVSVLDEMPPGRQPVKTRILHPSERERAYAFVRSQVHKERQAFIIYPLVESSDKIDAKAAVDEQKRLQKEVFPNLRVGLMHGKLKAQEKDQVMNQFKNRELDILVATSVVEVGIDVPNATVMIIDGAERFGLAQLHQFRGRVGRGEHQSYCLLLSSSSSPAVNKRLEIVESTTDGFLLAEKDLEMRGPGEFLGTQQSGLPELPMASLADTRLLHYVRQVALDLLEQDPELHKPEHSFILDRVMVFWNQSGDLS